MLTTQIYTQGDPKNKKDCILNSITETELRNSLITEYRPIAGSKAVALAADFDVVIGRTPEESGEDEGRVLLRLRR